MWDDESIEKMNEIIKMVEKNGRINGSEITKLYNKVLNTRLNPTSCASCINNRYKTLKQNLETYQMKRLKALEEIDKFMNEDDDVVDVPNEEVKITTTKKGRPKKK